MGYTESALKQQEIIKESYPELGKFYQSELGNFEFTGEDFKKHIDGIMKWLLEFEDYFVMQQSGFYYLTNFV
jgi:hypothetical protein